MSLEVDLTSSNSAYDEGFSALCNSEITFKKDQPVIPANKNFAVAYLLLVIIPILGLSGVLRTGSKLVAPTAIGGPWKMQVNPPSLASLPCARSVATMREV